MHIAEGRGILKTTGQLTSAAYTNDEDCAALTGRVVREHVTKLGVTKNGDVVARVVRYIDLGRADAITPADPDAQLVPETCGPENKQTRPARQALREKAIERHAEIQVTLIAYLMEHGPTPSAQMAAGTGLSINVIRPHLSQRSNTVYTKLYVPGHRHKVWDVILREEES